MRWGGGRDNGQTKCKIDEEQTKERMAGETRYEQRRHSFRENQTLCSRPLCLGYKRIKERVQHEMNLQRPGLDSDRWREKQNQTNEQKK